MRTLRNARRTALRAAVDDVVDRKICVKRTLVALVLALAGATITACSIPRWPVRGPMTSAYGVRMRGVLPELHEGVDVYVPEGTPVNAMKDGRVTHAGGMGGFGLAVVIDHGGSMFTLYGHLSRVDVRVGDRVNGSQPIGLSGSTGNATGPHLHFEVWRRGRTEDPVPLLGGKPRRENVTRRTAVRAAGTDPANRTTGTTRGPPEWRTVRSASRPQPDCSHRRHVSDRPAHRRRLRSPLPTPVPPGAGGIGAVSRAAVLRVPGGSSDSTITVCRCRPAGGR
jgi:murein DD-endopeptidase MepM/ murein hydrolase activator NlpD